MENPIDINEQITVSKNSMHKFLSNKSALNNAIRIQSSNIPQ
jgi:hypothetical protein